MGKHSSHAVVVCVPYDNKFMLQIELSANLLDNVAYHHQGVQFFLKTTITSFGDIIEMLSEHKDCNGEYKV